MCWTIKVNGKWCETIGELRKAIYPDSDKIAYHGVYRDDKGVLFAGIPLTEDCCLCPVDKEATAKALGLVAIQPPDEGGDWEFVEPTDA